MADKMYQVHDDNYSAYLTIAPNEREAFLKVYQKMEKDGCPPVDFDGEDDSDVQVMSFEKFCKEWIAQELDTVALIDSDGPIDFY